MKYIFTDGFSMMREHGRIISSGFVGSMSFAGLGRWVLRDPSGLYVDIHHDDKFLINEHSLIVDRIEG